MAMDHRAPDRALNAARAVSRRPRCWAALPTALAAIFLALPGVARADVQPSLLGAATLDRGDWGGWVAIGVPDLEVGARFGQTSLTDLGGRLRLSGGTGSSLGGFGATGTALVRLRAARLGGWDLAITAEPGLTGHAAARTWAPYVAAHRPGNTGLFGIDAGVPGVVASTWLSPTLHLTVGLSAPLRVWIAPEPTLEVPILLHVSGEARVEGRWSALAAGEVGTTFYGPGAGSPASDVVWRLRLGIGWR